MAIAVYETFDGWFVQAKHPIGPFISKEWAVGVAEGMVFAIRSTGEQANLVVEERRTWAAPKKAAVLRSKPPGPRWATIRRAD
ncbi:hypothetical protein [Phenylobacterium sp.]|jgi:hypothetical protein|uniref:hypothetical protein n=1 Tax=Phenylobacterium sp. TaxID=1871053 RepID=UPI002F4180E2